jgi:hypothetical protein
MNNDKFENYDGNSDDFDSEDEYDEYSDYSYSEIYSYSIKNLKKIFNFSLLDMHVMKVYCDYRVVLGGRTGIKFHEMIKDFSSFTSENQLIFENPTEDRIKLAFLLYWAERKCFIKISRDGSGIKNMSSKKTNP